MTRQERQKLRQAISDIASDDYWDRGMQTLLELADLDTSLLKMLSRLRPVDIVTLPKEDRSFSFKPDGAK